MSEKWLFRPADRDRLGNTSQDSSERAERLLAIENEIEKLQKAIAAYSLLPDYYLAEREAFEKPLHKRIEQLEREAEKLKQ